VRKEHDHAIENLDGSGCCGTFARVSDENVGGLLAALRLWPLVPGTFDGAGLLDAVLVRVRRLCPMRSLLC
jgi:hypothetical protein